MHFPGLVFSWAVQARYRLKKTAMAFMLENQMPLTSLEPSRQKLVLSVIEEYHGPIVSVSTCNLHQGSYGCIGVSTQVAIGVFFVLLSVLLFAGWVNVVTPSHREHDRNAVWCPGVRAVACAPGVLRDDAALHCTALRCTALL